MVSTNDLEVTGVNASPLLITAKDDELVGASSRLDAMGVLAIWSVRGRDLVPHLTEQTTNICGFQILVEAFRLWELYEPAHPEHADRLDDFFLLIEQAFARTVAFRGQEWNLPGARRVRARSSETPRISLEDSGWHLLGGQKANGLWGLYRGASGRAGLLREDMMRLSEETMRQATLNTRIVGRAQNHLFNAVQEAMNGRTVELPTRMTNALTRALTETFRNVPLADHLHARLIEGDDLNQRLAARLLDVDKLEHRNFLTDAARDLPEHQAMIEDAVRCEDVLAVVEAVFLWLCARKGETVRAAVENLPVDLDAFGAALELFAHSGFYRGDTAATRHRRFCTELDPSSNVELARSVLLLHEKVSDERKRAPWVWDEQGVLLSDVEVERPSERELRVGAAWRNDYYLAPLRGIAKQLAEARE